MEGTMGYTPQLRTPYLDNSHNNSKLNSSASKTRRLTDAHKKMLTMPNDDEKEKELKESAKLCANGIDFPCPQLSEHFTLCLRLSMQNKITKKNAFDLHLIQEVQSAVVEQPKVDFTLAAYSVEASGRIYAGRVSSMQDSSNKCKKSIIMVDQNGKEDEEDGDGDGIVESGEEEEQIRSEKKKNESSAEKQRKRMERKKRKTFLSADNTKSITLDKIPTKKPPNPLFDKKIRLCDMSTQSLLMNNLTIMGDNSQLIFDQNILLPEGYFSSGRNKDEDDDEESEDEIEANFKKNKQVEDHNNNVDMDNNDGIDKNNGTKKIQTHVNIYPFRSILSLIINNDVPICPSLDFQMPTSDLDSIKTSLFPPRNRNEDEDDNEGEGFYNDLLPNGGNEDDYEYEGFREADSLKNPLDLVEEAVNKVRKGDFSVVKEALMDHDDYEPITEDYIRSWAMKKFGVKSKDFKGPDRDMQKAASAKRKKTKTELLIDLQEILSPEDRNKQNKQEESDGENSEDKKIIKKIELLIKSKKEGFKKNYLKRGRVRITKKKLKPVSDLPESMNLSQYSFDSLYFMNAVKLQQANKEERKEVDLQVYNFENIYDRINYCPEDNGDADADADGGFDLISGDDYDAGDENDENKNIIENNYDDINNNNSNNDDNDNEKVKFSNIITTDYEDEEDDENNLLNEKNLLPMPPMVEVKPIEYLKKPKYIDMRKLKHVMHRIISHIKKSSKTQEDTNKVDEQNITTSSSISSLSSSPTSKISLTSIYKEMQNKLSSREFNELSMHLAYAALLQIASDRNYYLTTSKEIDDIIVSVPS